MKRDLSILLSVLMIFSLGTIRVDADDVQIEEVNQELIDEWTSTVESLSNIYFEDLSDVEFVKSDILNDQADLATAEKALADSKEKFNEITSTYNAAVKEKEEADNAVASKENVIKTIEASLDTNIEAERTKLEEYKKAEDDAWNKAIDLAPASDEYIAKLLDEYETSSLNVGNCEYQLNKAKENLEFLKLLGRSDDFLSIAQSEVEKWENTYSEATKELNERKQKYDEAVANKETTTKAQEEAIAEYETALNNLKTQQAKVDEMEAELEKNNNNLAEAKENLGFLQITQAEKDDAYFKAKEAYDDANTEVGEAEILVEIIKDSVKDKETLLEICNDDLNVSKEAYEKANEYLESIKSTYRTNKLDELNKLINVEINYNLYEQNGIAYYNAILEDSKNVYKNEESTIEKIVDAVDSMKEAYKKLLSEAHEIVYVEGKTETCTEDGHSAYYKCTKCGKLFTDETLAIELKEVEIIKAKGHFMTKVEAVASTISSIGNIEYYKCNNCDKLFVKDDDSYKEIEEKDIILAIIDSNELDNKINSALTDLSSYTKSSADAYTKALNNAKLVKETNSSTKEDVENAIKELNNALNNLKVKTQAEKPTVSLESNTYNSGQVLTLKPGNEGLKVVYKVNGEILAKKSSDNRIELKGIPGESVEYTISAYTEGNDDYSNSELATFKYTISIGKPSEVVIEKNSGVIAGLPIKNGEEAPKYEFNVNVESIELNEDEKEAIKQNHKVSIDLVIKVADNIKTESVVSVIDNQSKYDLGTTFDISLISTTSLPDGEVLQQRQVENVDKNDPVSITIPIPEECLPNRDDIERTYKVLRIHDGIEDYLDGHFDSSNNTFTFETDRFSTYALVYEDKVKETSSNTSSNVRSCEDVHGVNWVWMGEKLGCRYKVTNTSSK